MTDHSIRYVRAFGITLIVLGVLSLVGRIFSIEVGPFLWPFFIIVPGVLLFILSVAIDGVLSEPVAMLGGMATSVGLLLLYQSTTGHWASWAYAWALVTPTSVGLARMLYGKLKGRAALVREGWAMTKVGLILFVVGLIFFELILNISGFGLGFVGWPILFIGLGLIFLLRGLWHPRA